MGKGVKGRDDRDRGGSWLSKGLDTGMGRGLDLILNGILHAR